MAEGQAGVFPTDKEEGKTFILNLVKYINEDDEVERILTENKGGDAPINAMLGALAAQLLTLLFTKLYEETGGEQVSAEFAIMAVRIAVKELADIAKGIGWKVERKDEQDAAKVGGDTLDTSMQELYSGAGQQVAPPAGMLQGGM